MSSCLDKMLSKNTIVTASYKVISDFESSSEKECSKVDSVNEKMYSKLLTQAQKAQDTLINFFRFYAACRNSSSD